MKKIILVAPVAAIAAAATLYFFAQKGGEEATPPSGPAQAVAQSAPADMLLPMPNGLKGDPDKGRVFFMSNCFTCHGVKGDGEGPRAYFITPPPRNFLLESSRQRLNRPVLFEAIANGRPGTNMPAWARVLNDQEIANVAEFVFQEFISAPQGDKGTPR